MLPFATEFPVKRVENRAAFVAELMGWLSGTEYSTILSREVDNELSAENADLKAKSGEELRIRQVGDVDWRAIGFRHDFPDQEGRLWRTEAVLSREIQGHDVVRLKTQCIARLADARLEFPRKPYLVKSLLKNGWGGQDGELSVLDSPLLLEKERDIEIAKAVVGGSSSVFLPVVYISAIDDRKWMISEGEISKLAYDLGGIAHVILEPDRGFSFHLRDICGGKNVYGGSIGISVPGLGIVRRIFLNWKIQNKKELIGAVRSAATNIRSQMPALGWDWIDLQEQALRIQRIRESKRLTAEESELLYKAEIENLEDKIKNLEQIISASTSNLVQSEDNEFSTDNLNKMIGPEVYPGEISDRLRFAAKTITELSDKIGLDDRSSAILVKFLNNIPASPALSELVEDISRACKDPKRLAGSLTSLLSRHGYRAKAENKHVRLEPAKGYDGLQSITISKTPSDARGLKNMRAQVERALGLNKLS